MLEPQKRKRISPRHAGCLKLLLIPILLAVACYGGMWGFARYGIQLVIRDQFPVPSGSQTLMSHDASQAALIFSQWAVSYEQVVYSHPWSADTLVEWFEEQGFFTVEENELGIFIRPNCVYTEVGRGMGSCHDPTTMKAPPETWIRWLYKISYELTAPDHLPSPLPTCGRVVVYRTMNSALNNFSSELRVENVEGTIFVVDSCSVYVQ